MTPSRERPYTTDRDISSSSFWARPFPERDETFAWLRANAPVSYHAPMVRTGIMRDIVVQPVGFWAVTRAEDIHYVSQHYELFSCALMPGPDGTTMEHRDKDLLAMDPPEHTWYRNVMSAAFTPKGVSRIADRIDERAEKIVTDVVGAGEFDFVERVSSRLPMLTVADMVGVAESDVEAFAEAGNNIMNAVAAEGELPEGADPTAFYFAQLTTLRDIGLDLVRYRRDHPADDIATALALGDIDGRPLTDRDVVSTMVLLAAAGNDTTKHTTSWTALQFCRHPEQREWLLADFEGRIGQSIEEFVRFATVVITFPRTVTTDVELHGQQLREGEVVNLFYCSGNRDEALFADPNRFDLARPRATNVAFGGRGVHYCLGNVVAKVQLRSLFWHVLTKLPGLELDGEPTYLHSDFINGISRMPVRA